MEASERSYELIITFEMVKMPLEVADVNFQTQKHFSDHFHTYLGGGHSIDKTLSEASKQKRGFCRYDKKRPRGR